MTDRSKQIDDDLAKAVAEDADTPWSKAWIANQMAKSDLVLRRVPNDEDNPDCCKGMQCMHYVRVNKARVIERGRAVLATGKAIDEVDGALYFATKFARHKA